MLLTITFRDIFLGLILIAETCALIAALKEMFRQQKEH